MNEYLKPKKSLSQNFLIDENISRKIVNLLDCKENENVIEIGPGTGSLTQYLLKYNINLTSVEIDKEAFEILLTKFNKIEFNNFNLINKDFLKISIKDIFDKINSELINDNNKNPKKIKIIGNLPYHISSEIFFKILENSFFIENAVLMLQKEVAQRLIAKTKTKEYGILTVAINLLGKIQKKFDVSPTCFYPQPKVTSTIVELNFDHPKVNIEEFIRIMVLVRAAFNQRRKKLKNALENYLIKYLKPIQIKLILNEDVFAKRAEELSAEDFISLYNLIKSTYEFV